MSPEEPSVPPAETPREKAERLWEAEGYAAAAYVAADGDAAYDDAFERGKARWKKEHSPPKAEGKERP